METFVPANCPPKQTKPSPISSPLWLCPHTTTTTAMDEKEVEGEEDESVDVFFSRCFSDTFVCMLGGVLVYGI